MIKWNNDRELLQIVRKDLFTAVIGDIMDQLGHYHQFLPPRVQPLDAEMKLAGRAMPVLEADCFDNGSAPGQTELTSKPFGLMLEALDDLKENEVYLCTGASPRYALWGELMSTRAIKLGAAGAVVDGYSRDTPGILQLGFPTFSYGRYAQDQAPRGKVIDFRVPIEIAGVRIRPGDLVVGDLEGVCIVPREIEEEVIRKAYEKAMGEKVVMKAIQEGMSAKAAFDKYGIM